MTSPNRSINFESGIHYSPVDEETAREFLMWKYDSPYEIYNYDPANFEKDLAYSLDPANNIHSMYHNDELIGYCSYGRDAQIPSGDYSEEAIDIGMMIKPEFTGQGLGTGFVANTIQYATATYKPRKLRVTILDSNLRAKRVWEKNGFEQNQTFERKDDKTLFVILTKDV